MSLMDLHRNIKAEPYLANIPTCNFVGIKIGMLTHTARTVTNIPISQRNQSGGSLAPNLYPAV